MKTETRLGIILVGNKLSDLLLSAKTTLPTLLSSAGAPPWMAQLLVPIRESGALLPQMAFAYVMRKYPHRDLAWQLSMFLQFVSGCLMIGLGLTLDGHAAGYVILASLVLMSLSRALSSLTTKDIQGQHVDKGSRGRLLGSASTVSSLISISIAVLALIGSGRIGSDKLIVIAAIALGSKLICMWLMRPLKTEVDTQARAVSKGLYFDSTLAKFVTVRSLFAHTALLAPLFVLTYDGDMINILAYLIIAQGLANFFSSYLWGSLSDKSALACMRAGSAVAIAATFTLLVLPHYYPNLASSIWFVVGLFFILGIGHQGVRTGRKIYGVDIADEQHRTEFIATSNTVVGACIMLLGGIYAAINAYSRDLSLSLMLIGLTLGLLGSLFLKAEK
ncbi:MFS transporter [Glaciecola siphonariae]|uniref:MFS transporter n=1 Tax=Glaciecola siphonariae TaxID=521012 RepID=A0ABV9LU18_9ALTE